MGRIAKAGKFYRVTDPNAVSILEMQDPGVRVTNTGSQVFVPNTMLEDKFFMQHTFPYMKPGAEILPKENVMSLANSPRRTEVFDPQGEYAYGRIENPRLVRDLIQVRPDLPISVSKNWTQARFPEGLYYTLANSGYDKYANALWSNRPKANEVHFNRYIQQRQALDPEYGYGGYGDPSADFFEAGTPRITSIDIKNARAQRLAEEAEEAAINARYDAMSEWSDADLDAETQYMQRFNNLRNRGVNLLPRYVDNFGY